MKRAASEHQKFQASLASLERALKFEKKAQTDPFYFAGITKSFEVCLEYAWKYLKNKAIDAGLEAYSPKDAIKQAGRMGLVENVEDWLDYLKDRNLAVHDYLGVSDEDYMKNIHRFIRDAQRLLRK